QKLLARFEDDVTKVAEWIETASATDYAAIAPIVVDHAASGDEAARALMEDAGRHIGGLVEALFRLGAPQVALSGGLAEAVKLYMHDSVAPRLVAAQADAAAGGIILAKRLASNG